jgi:hypothetical protein
LEWEKKIGYCRAIAVGNQVFVGLTGPMTPDEVALAKAPPSSSRRARSAMR